MARLIVPTWSIDTLGNWLLLIIKLGHSNLLCGIYRTKLTFPLYKGQYDLQVGFYYPKLLMLPVWPGPDEVEI